MQQEWSTFLDNQSFPNNFEMLTTLDDASLVELNYLGHLCVSGADAKKFLQGQLTCDLEKVTPEQSQLGAYTTLQGKIISTFRIFMRNDNYYLSMHSGCVDLFIERIKKYAVFSKVTIERDDNLAAIGLLNFTADIPEDLTQIVISNSRTEIHGDAQSLMRFWSEHQTSAKLLGHQVWQLLDIQDGIAQTFPETQEHFLPHRINLHNIDGVSFEKGCYLGQEVISRMHYRGKLKHHLHQVELQCDIAPKPGDSIYADEQTMAEVVSCIAVAENTYQALLVIADKYEAESASFLDKNNGQPVAVKRLQKF